MGRKAAVGPAGDCQQVFPSVYNAKYHVCESQERGRTILACVLRAAGREGAVYRQRVVLLGLLGHGCKLDQFAEKVTSVLAAR